MSDTAAVFLTIKYLKEQLVDGEDDESLTALVISPQLKDGDFGSTTSHGSLGKTWLEAPNERHQERLSFQPNPLEGAHARKRASPTKQRSMYVRSGQDKEASHRWRPYDLSYFQCEREGKVYPKSMSVMFVSVSFRSQHPVEEYTHY